MDCIYPDILVYPSTPDTVQPAIRFLPEQAAGVAEAVDGVVLVLWGNIGFSGVWIS